MTTNPSSSASSGGWEPPLPEELQAMLPQYEITGILGRGGMGAVYKGRQARLNRTVAIKLLPETLTGDGEDTMKFAERFELEAQSMAALDHPAIVSVFDFGETSEGQLYFVMEFIDGMDIHQYLKHRGGTLPQDEALSITAHVLDALQYAHKRGIVHRDIKPANVLLDQEGRVKIADFGLAKTLSTDEGEADAPALTMSNVAVGTPDFVAPEALDGDQVPDHRADLYAVGVMLYQLLTGKLPRGSFKLPSDLREDLDPRLDDILDRTLEPDPDERFSSADEMRLAMDPVISTPMSRMQAVREEAVAAELEEAPEASPAPTSNVSRSRLVKKKEPAKGLYLGIGIAALLVVVGVVSFLGKPDTAENAAEVAEIEQEEPAVEASSQPAPPPEEPKVTVATPDPTGKAPPVADTVAMVADSPDSETAPAESTAADPTPSDPSPSEADAPPAMEEPTVTKADTPPEPESSPLLAIPGLQARLDWYLKTQSTKVGNLATSYLGGLNSRLERAADAGDLPLVEAFRGEQEKIGNLQEELASHPADLIAGVTQKVTLPSLDEETPGELVELRQIWTGERQKIRESLDLDLQQSLKALESQLTRDRDFDNAKKVSTYRESLAEAVGSDSATTTVEVASAPASPSSQSDGDSATPIQGRLRFQGVFEGGTTKDFSAAGGITDFVEVHLTTGNFLALRANGKIVTSSVRVNDHGVENFVRICPGLGMVFFEDAVGIDQSGKGHYLYGRTNYPVAPLQEQPHPIADVIVSSKYSLLLLSDGSIRWWGSNYEGANGIPKWPEPPEEARQGIQAIALHHDFAAVLTKTGKVIAWTKDGVWDLPRNFDRNVTKIGAAWNALTALNNRGEAFCILTGQSEIGPFEYRNASDLKSIPVGQEVSAIQLEDGTWRHAYKPDEAPPYGLRRFPSVVNELPKIPILSERSFDIITHGNRKCDAIAWIEPVEPGDNPTQESDVAGPSKIAPIPASPKSDVEDSAAPIQGRLRFQGAFDGGTSKDFSAADGITDFVEVHLMVAAFLALRANGEVVSNDNRVTSLGLENIVRICPGLDPIFWDGAVGIDQSGKGHYLMNTKNLPESPLKEQPHPIVDAMVSRNQSLLLLSDRSIRWWGSYYEGANGIPAWPEPPEEARQGIQAIALHPSFAAVLTKTGKVIAWTKDGVWDLPRNFDRNVTKIGAAWNALTALNNRGEAFCILTGQSEIGPFEYRNASDLKSIPVGQEVSAIQLEDGTWRHAYKPDEAPPYGLRRFPNVVNELPKIPILSERSFDIITHGNRKCDAIAWIEPVDAGEEPAQ
ncbi:MAG: protein kinase [Verrucomicrobiales bacterium]|nr:protein kinase [Verrucomicrobiales bacterium]